MRFSHTAILMLSACSLLAPMHGSAMPQAGKEVRKIPLSTPISSWEAIDNKHLLLTVGSNDQYVVTLGQACHSLPFAARVGVSSSNAAVYAGFDYVTADNQRCMIRSINRVEKD